MINIRKFPKGLKIEGVTNASLSSDTLGELQVDSTNGKLTFHNGSARQNLLTESGTQTLTGKTIDGDDNTIQDLALSSLKTVIGDANKMLARDGSGVVVSVSALPTAVVIDGDVNTVQDLALTSLKTVLGDANKFLTRDAAGIVVSTIATPTGAVVGTTDTQQLTNKDIVGATLSLNDSDSAFNLGVVSTSTLTADRVLTIDVNDAARTLTLSADVTLDGTEVKGPASATDNAIARYDGTTGKLIQNSGATIDDSGNLAATNFSGSSSGTNSGDVTLAAIGATPNANGASLAAQVLNLQPADASFGGVVTTGAQTFAGVKTFNAAPLLKSALDIEDPGAGTNKVTIQAPTLGASYTLTLPVDDGLAAQVLSTDGAGVLSWSDGGSGSGNCLLSAANSKFEQNTVGSWARYLDAAGVDPVDGTGGSPSGSMTITTTGTSPLDGSYSLLLTKDATNRQGEGFSLSSIAVPLAYRGQTAAAGFYYTVASGTYVAGDMRVWIYDETNSALIVGNIQALPATAIGVAAQFMVTFSIPTNTASLRFIVHQSSTSASAYTIKFDDFCISPGYSNVVQSVAIGDWTAYTPTFTGLGTVSSVAFFYRRVGDSYEINGKLTTGTVTAVAASISLPNGAILNTAYHTPGNKKVVGRWTMDANGPENAGKMLDDTTTSTSLIYFARSENISGVNAMTVSTGTAQFNNTTNLAVDFIVSASGLTSGIALANSRVEYASNSGMGAGNDSTSFVNDVNGSPWPAVAYAAEANRKRVRFTTPIQPTDTIQVQYKDPDDGIWIAWVGHGGDSGDGYDLLHYENNAGYGWGRTQVINSTDVDVVFGHYSFNGTTYGGAGKAWDATSGTYRWRVVKYSNAVPVEVASPVIAVYHLSNSSAITSYTLNAFTKVDWDTKIIDTHNSVTTGTGWKFTAPISAYYQFEASLNFSAPPSSSAAFRLYANGVDKGYMGYDSSATDDNIKTGAYIIRLEAGQLLEIKVYSGGSTTTFTGFGDPLSNGYFSIRSL